MQITYSPTSFTPRSSRLQFGGNVNPISKVQVYSLDFNTAVNKLKVFPKGFQVSLSLGEMGTRKITFKPTADAKYLLEVENTSHMGNQVYTQTLLDKSGFIGQHMPRGRAKNELWPYPSEEYIGEINMILQQLVDEPASPIHS